MVSFEFVVVAVITQHIIGFVKSLFSGLQKSSCDLVQARAEANRAKIVISKQRTETDVSSGLYKRATGIAERVSVTSEKACLFSSSHQKH